MQSNAGLQAKIAADAHGTRFAADFKSWATSPSDTSVLAGKVGADCAAVDVLNGGTPISTTPPSQAAAPTPSPTPPAPTMTNQTDQVVFKVWGSGYPSITYGADSSSNQVPGGNGPLGDGVALPWSATVTYSVGALYYAVTAQLEGSGAISDSVTEVVTTWCSGQAPKTESFTLASGNASGGYAIAQAEYAGGDTGNALPAESDAGC